MSLSSSKSFLYYSIPILAHILLLMSNNSPYLAAIPVMNVLAKNIIDYELQIGIRKLFII